MSTSVSNPEAVTTEEHLQKVREPIPFTPTKRLKRDDVLYVTEDDIPHPIYGYAKYHKEYSVIDLRGYRKGYEPRLEISGIYTPNPEDIFRLQTGKLPPYQPTTTGDELLAEMRRLGVHKAFRIGNPEEVPAVPEVEREAEIKYFRQQETKWRETAYKIAEEERGEAPFAEAIRKADKFGRQATELEAIAKPPAVKTEEWKLREAIADTVYGLAHGVKEGDIRKHLTRNPRAQYWFEPEDVNYILKEAKREQFLKRGNPIPDGDLARTLAIIDSRPKGRIIESKLREEFGDAVIDALRQGRYVVSGSAGYNPPLLVSLKGRELIQGDNPMGKVITKEKAIGLLERLSMTPGEAARSLVADEAERREIMQTVQQRVKREQNKWAPMDPREGPPLPRIFAGLRWPWKK